MSFALRICKSVEAFVRNTFGNSRFWNTLNLALNVTIDLSTHKKYFISENSSRQFKHFNITTFLPFLFCENTDFANKITIHDKKKGEKPPKKCTKQDVHRLNLFVCIMLEVSLGFSFVYFVFFCVQCFLLFVCFFFANILL